MIIRPLSRYESSTSATSGLYADDHYIYTEEVKVPRQVNEHRSALALLSVLKGEADVRINGKRTSLTEDCFIVINKGSSLAMEVKRAGTVPVIVIFNTTLSGIIQNSSLFTPPDSRGRTPVDFSLIEYIHYTHASLKTYMLTLLDLGKSCASFHALKADMVLRSILNHLIRENYSAMQVSSNLNVVRESTRIDLYKRLCLGKQWMEKHFCTPVTLNQVAAIAMMNEEHFLRLFKQAFNVTPGQYLTQLRLGYAKHLLSTTAEQVGVICQRIGFESPSSFTGLFKKRFGITPAAYRKTS